MVVVLASFGLYKMFPQIAGPVDYYIKNPTFQKDIVSPAVVLANKILPEKIQIPTPEVMGVQTEFQGESPIKQLTDQVTKQASDLAAQQIVQIKKTASDQFCQALLEKIKTECGQ
jgi:hypothetical protein